MEQLPDFTGKVVSLYLRQPPTPLVDGCILEYATFREIGGHLFLHGRVPEHSGPEWVYHVQNGVRWDEVVSYLVFDSVEDYVARARTYKPTLRERLGLG